MSKIICCRLQKASEMNVPLFRTAAIAAKTSRWHGAIIIARPIPMQMAGWLSLSIIVSLALFLIFGEYTRKVRVSGQIVPAAGAIKVVAFQSGLLSTKMVEEGASVIIGQPLFTLTSERTDATGAVDARIGMLLAVRHDELVRTSELQTTELAQRARALEARQRSIEAEVRSRQQEVALQDLQINIALEKLKRFETLANQGFFSQAQLGQVRGELAAEKARRKALESSVLAVQRDLLQVRDEADAINGKIELIGSQAGQSLAVLSQESAEHEARRHIQVLAPVSGVVTALSFSAGQSVSAGASMATIIPAGCDLEAHLMVPSRAVGFIQPGQMVLLRLGAFAYQKFGQVAGTVVGVERSPVAEASAAADPVYRITVRLSRQSVTAYGRKQEFKAGMALEADILQDRRRLIEWIVDPIISAAKDRG
jgi:membrane fusion protein